MTEEIVLGEEIQKLRTKILELEDKLKEKEEKCCPLL